MDLPTNLSISPIFNAVDLIKFKGPMTEVDVNKQEVRKDVQSNVLPSQVQLEADQILDSIVKNTTRHKVYMEHLIKWKHRPNSQAMDCSRGFQEVKNHINILATGVT